MTSKRIIDWWSNRRLAIYQAVREVGTVAVVTLTPVWAGAILSLLLREIPSFYAALYANTNRGDLFLLAGAMMAPLSLYLSVRRDALPKPFTIHFPGGWFFIIVLVLLFGSSTILFAVKRVADLPNSALNIDQSLFLKLSFFIYAASFVLSLVVTTIKYALDSLTVEEAFREDTEEFLEAWSRRER